MVEVPIHLEEINRRRGDGIHWDDCGGDSDETFAKHKETYERIYEECSDGDAILIVSHGAAVDAEDFAGGRQREIW